MKFLVNYALATPGGDRSTPAPALQLDPSPGGVEKLEASAVTRDLALLEEESALLCVTFDAVTGAISREENSAPPNCNPALSSVLFGPKAAVLGVNGANVPEAQLWDDPIA